MDISYGYQSSSQKISNFTLSDSLYFIFGALIANFQKTHWDLSRGKGPSAVGDEADSGRATGEVYLVFQQLMIWYLYLKWYWSK